MFPKQLWQLCVVGLSIATCNVALAQTSFTPRSDVGGYAGRELSRIYRSDIGTGYSGTSLNQLSLNSARLRAPTSGQSSGRGRLDLGVGSPVTNKPFSNYSPPPSVSPYLNLFREDFEGNSDLNYQTLVQPLLQQRQVNEQLQRQNFAIAQRLQSMSAQSDFNPQGSQAQPPTGHQTVFMYHGHYYPSPARRRR